MKKYLTITAAAVFALAALCACGKERSELEENTDNEFRPVALTKAEEEVSASANAFGFDLYHRLYESKQMLVSPLSLSLALSLASCGADGNTASQMASVLGFDGFAPEDVAGYYKKMIDALGSIDKKTTFESANSVWMDKSLDVKKSFLDTADEYYASEKKSVDFKKKETVDAINGWCAEKTHGKIEKIIDSIDPATVMALVNALYFNGKWGGFQFDENTRKEDFKTMDGGKTKVDMMSAEGSFLCSFKDGWSMINLPYGNTAFAMSVILPPEDMSFTEAVKAFNIERWYKMSIGGSHCIVNLKLPEFKIDYEADMNDALRSLGMTDAFNPAKADFTGIADADLCIGVVKHKTFIDVNTKGTEAAAVTFIGMLNSAAPPSEPQEIDFIADRSFLFVIHEQSTGAILFIGQKVG